MGIASLTRPYTKILRCPPANASSVGTDSVTAPVGAKHAVHDSNTTITIVMDTDRHVEAVWKCGSGGSLLLPIALSLLALFVWTRRSR